MSDLSSAQSSSAQSSSANSSGVEATEQAMPSLMEVALSGAIALAKDGNNLDAANAQFEALLAQLAAESPAAAPLLKRLWKEYLAVQRSARFYESLSDAEKELSDKMAESTIQLKQNYMRLVQEQ